MIDLTTTWWPSLTKYQSSCNSHILSHLPKLSVPLLKPEPLLPVPCQYKGLVPLLHYFHSCPLAPVARQGTRGHSLTPTITLLSPHSTTSGPCPDTDTLPLRHPLTSLKFPFHRWRVEEMTTVGPGPLTVKNTPNDVTRGLGRRRPERASRLEKCPWRNVRPSKG